MKRLLFFLLASLSLIAATAQTYEAIKTLTIIDMKKAKVEIDKAMANPKFTSKAEAYMLKTTIYAAFAMDETNKNTQAGLDFAKEADAAFQKYREMDPALTMVKDPVYQNGPVNLYSSYYTSGYTDYSDKKYEAGYQKLKRAVEYSDLLIEKQLLTAPVDTNVLILAGITAENSNHKDEAAKYYTRMADLKIKGDGFESVYRFLVAHYFGKKDIPLFEKYKAIGAELYPKSEFFAFDKIDFAVGLETNFDAKVKSVEEVLATDPTNYKANEVLGEIIYDTLNSRNENAPLPSNADELEKKMDAAFRKAAVAKPDFENPWLYLGDHYINKAVKVDDARTALAGEIKARTKPGTMASKDDVAKRDALDKKYGDALEMAREPYEKAAALFAAHPSLDMKQKQQYKKAASYLIDIYAYKKVTATKMKSPDAVKYATEEKKWNDRWESIK